MSHPHATSHHAGDAAPSRSSHPQSEAVHQLHPALPHRLPPNVVPSHYELHLTPNLTTFKYTATIHITLNILTPTRTIRLNADELTIKSASLARSAGGAAVKLAATFEKEDEVCVLTAR